ncbi:MAG: hypothetical protein ONB48_18090 [candidate division KSB1 bacterium]|nr:hypothetical protein [candidate division KSB1 bacterium]MDZ7275803.1 hypothetical protein [candidate division KSB1 bacterium]MDZ7287555.1 hypothetical protein [candidate division KSB1 bacterium]MDZ7308041.1 hypothetical protein [candidate division KSB1 bacterium]MDZ7350533.1 hypothetical protein [candidate division KSB1 bacterium]
MLELSEKICQLNGVLGTAILDQLANIHAITCLTETADAILQEMAPAMHRALQSCSMHEQDLHSLSLKFQDFTVFAKIFETWLVAVVCRNEQIFYLLDSSITALATEYFAKLQEGENQAKSVSLRARKKTAEEFSTPRMNALCGEILKLVEPSFAQPETATRFILRQLSEHLKISPEELQHSHLPDLADWVSVSARLFIDHADAAELGNKIRRMC